jgi:hypothetical protein
MFNLTKDSDLKEIGCNIHNFLNKFGFNDGNSILQEEEKSLKRFAKRL